MNRDPRHRVSCGAVELSEYAAGRLSPARVAIWDAHLRDCARCRYALAEEQWVRTRLSTGAPSMSGGLHSSLLAMAQSGPPVPPPAPSQRVSNPTVVQVPVLSPGAPPAHRSALRCTSLAVAAVGASLAAAWSLGVVATSSAAGASTGPRVGPAALSSAGPSLNTPAATSLVRTSVLWRPATPTQDPNAPCVADPAQSSP